MGSVIVPDVVFTILVWSLGIFPGDQTLSVHRRKALSPIECPSDQFDVSG